MKLEDAWDDERLVAGIDWKDTGGRISIRVPDWIEQDIRVNTLAAIVQGGCDSGAYMPAVTYHEAMATMAEHGDAVLTYLQDADLLPLKLGTDDSWSGFACKVLSTAVDLWAGGALEEIEPEEEDCDSMDPKAPSTCVGMGSRIEPEGESS